MSERLRNAAREIFLHALQECSMERAFARHVECSRGVLRICEDLYDLNNYSRVFVVSIGKAAYPMLEALVAQTGGLVHGIAAGPGQPARQVPGFRYFAGGHPMPNAESVRAGEAILKSLRSLPPNSLVLFLISGGGSSIVEKPADDEISLADLVEAYRVLVHSGAPIAEINAIRKHLSATKGGRLAQAAGEAQQVSVLISDVPSHAPDSLASGPTMADSTSVEDCYRIAAKYGMVEKFPASVRELFERRALDETPTSDNPVFIKSRYWTILSSDTAAEAAARKAAEMGFAAEIDNSCDDWDYREAAGHLVGRMQELRSKVSRVCLISAGEVTVQVSGEAGKGGRNQQFALHCAGKIRDGQAAILSAGTDGVDGNSPAAGAVVDETTLERAQEAGINVDDALARFDAYPVFQQLGDAIETGPTGTNVRDLRIFLSE